jgi:hypothetical protein
MEMAAGLGRMSQQIQDVPGLEAEEISGENTKFKFVHWLKNGIPKGDEIHTVLVLKKPFLYLIN